MTRTNQTYDIDSLIRLLGDQMSAVANMRDQDLSLQEQLKWLDMLGKTCSRLATLIEKQRKIQGDDSSQLNQVLAQVMQELMKSENGV